MKIVLCLLALLVPTLASAQTHPCDVAVPTLYREPAAQLPNLRVGFCFELVDTSGIPITDPVGFSLSVNGGADIDLGILAPTGGPNAAGESFYVFQHAALAAGTITLKAYTTVAGMSAPSAPITLTLLGSPKPPKGARIERITR